LLDHSEKILDEGGDVVVALRVPATFAVPSVIHGDGIEAHPPELLRGTTPGMTGLPPSVKEQHGRIIGVSIGIGGNRDPVGKLESER